MKKFSYRSSIRWSIAISIVTFIFACIFSIAATAILEGVSWALGMLTVFIIILIGIFFDMIGLASAAAIETPFHAMASEKIKGAKQGIRIVRNADRFSSFCNDVIGDMSGVISGVASGLVILKLIGSANANPLLHTMVTVVFAGVVSALTVGGKAMGKSIAIHFSTQLILYVGKIFYFLEHQLGIIIFNGKKNKSNHGKRGKKRGTRSN
ncbi:hypothetical protein [Chengkuizengella sediminis]|uniref:hypothetical protein n=1 Tax=Chengkuizengella sediminis TaxID=1885917 RepID=UPI001389FB64|nr:hypothetical protein [Chengkuizengella sediminis]NDI34230.1 hypothetical protein [Chengkuizengella sediminis]